jgi:hypothetical protein
MKIINSSGVYSIILNEDEWYSATDQQREAWTVECKREAERYACRHASILVEPDAVLSIAPSPKRHIVWTYNFPVPAETVFREALESLYFSDHKLSRTRMRSIAKQVFGL